MIQMLVNDQEFPLEDAVLDVRHLGQTMRFRATVAIRPSAGEGHRHESIRRNLLGRDLLAVPLDGSAPQPLVWVDTDQVSYCPTGCDGDHPTWYVQKLICPLCDADLDAIQGEDQGWFSQGEEVTLRCTLPPGVADYEVTVTGLGDEPVTFRGEVTWNSWEPCARFEGVARTRVGVSE